MRRTLLAALIALQAVLAASSAAALTQPNGTIIPQGSTLPDLFTSRGEAIDAQRDAAVLPERFVPGCLLNFTLVTRGPALFRNSFGWYNVTGARPDESDLHVLIPCDAPDGFVAHLDLRTETAFRGGEIGFFLRTPEDAANHGSCAGGQCCGRPGNSGFTYYTERAFNPDNTGANSYIHLLTYDSRVTPRAFYFAWEDLYGGGDNTFTDFVALVSNIVCSGAGAACDTGQPGICAAGTQQCRSGVLQCVGTVAPRTEACNGQDDDCNGRVDDGTDLCGAARVCVRGTCVDRCVEQSCFPDEVCTAQGACVQRTCATVECAAGQRCVDGACVAACDGVRCPGAQVCRAGRCVDPCEGVTCDGDQVCAAGVCVPRCECRRCPADQTCRSDGRCASTACASVTCPAGSSCVAGACQDDCAGAACPHGERCAAGQCVPDPGGADAGAVDAGARDGAVVDAARGDGAMDVSASRDGGVFPPRSSGCACRAAGGARPGAGRAPGLLVLSTLAVIAARRRRRRAR